MKPVYYLSGAVELCADGGRTWRIQFTEWLRRNSYGEVIDPTTAGCCPVMATPEWQNRGEPGTPRYIEIFRKMVDEQLEGLKNADIVLVYLTPNAGPGTYGELAVAYTLKKTILVALGEGMSYQDLRGWVWGCSTRIFPHFVELKKFIADFEEAE